jgi:hypothetical protein
MPFPPSVSGKTGGYDGLVPSVTVAVFVFPSRRYVSLTEYEMVRLLAQGDRASFIEFALGSAEFTQHVEGYGLVREARTDPRISLGLVRTHLARQPRRVEESDPADREALVVEISRRRTRIERAMRRFLREGLLFAHGKQAMNEALAALPEERRAVLTQFGYDPNVERAIF